MKETGRPVQHTATPRTDKKINFKRSAENKCIEGGPVPNPGSYDLYQKGYIFTVDLGCEVQLYWKRLDTDSGVCIFPGHWPNSQVISMAMTRKTPGTATK